MNIVLIFARNWLILSTWVLLSSFVGVTAAKWHRHAWSEWLGLKWTLKTQWEAPFLKACGYHMLSPHWLKVGDLKFDEPVMSVTGSDWVIGLWPGPLFLLLHLTGTCGSTRQVLADSSGPGRLFGWFALSWSKTGDEQLKVGVIGFFMVSWWMQFRAWFNVPDHNPRIEMPLYACFERTSSKHFWPTHVKVLLLAKRPRSRSFSFDNVVFLVLGFYKPLILNQLLLLL